MTSTNQYEEPSIFFYNSTPKLLKHASVQMKEFEISSIAKTTFAVYTCNVY
jgi:hypothetical protein